MKKRIISILLSLTLILSVLSLPVFAKVIIANVSASIDKTSASCGDTFVVTVSNSKMTVSSIACTVSFDTTLLEVVSIVDSNEKDKYKLIEFSDPEESNKATSVSTPTEANGNGNVGFVWVGTKDVVYAAGTIAKITFKVKEGATGTVTLTYSEDSAGSGGYKGSAGSGSVTIVNALTGTAKITGSAKFGQTLTASLEGSNNTGTLSYQWKRGGVAITGATSSTYTLVADDIGKAITVEISSSVETGSKTSSATSTVTKADGPAAPTGLSGVACSTKANNDGKITGVTIAMEYKKDDDASWTAITGTSVTGLTNGTYKVRYKETAYALASSEATVTVSQFVPNVLSGTAKIVGSAKFGQTLTASLEGSNNTGTLSYQWKRGGVAITGATSSTYTLGADDIGKAITVEISSSVETGSKTSSATSTVTKADGPAAPTSLSGVACSTKANNDGKITGVTTAMEYKKDDDLSWTDITGTSVTGLTNGTYKVRYKETATALAGAEATVTINQFVPNALIGSVRISGDVKYGSTLSVSVTDTNNTGTLSYQWKRGGVDISGATGTTYTVQLSDIGAVLSVEVKSSIETGSLNSSNTATVEKADGPAKPNTAVAVPCTDMSNSNGMIIGVNDKMEYKRATSSTWISVENDSITGLTPGTYKVRYKETETNKASAETTLVVNVSGSGIYFFDIIKPTASYAINVKNQKQCGSVSVNPNKAREGEIITIVVTPAEGYELDKLVIKGAKGEISYVQEENGSFAFVMPKSAVSVEVIYKIIEGTVVEPSNPFVDVVTDDYFYSPVMWAVENGITTGTDDTHFSPNADTTRAQMVTFLWRAAGCPIVDSEINFTDVDEDAYYTEAVRWAIANGITNGTSDTTFSPDKIVTRAQAVTFLYRYFKATSEVTVGENNPFVDVKADAYYAEAVRWAVENGITNGTSDTMFSPDHNCTRGQIVTFLYRGFVK